MYRYFFNKPRLVELVQTCLFCDVIRCRLYILTIRCLCFIDIDILVHFLIKHTIHTVYILNPDKPETKIF